MYPETLIITVQWIGGGMPHDALRRLFDRVLRSIEPYDDADWLNEFTEPKDKRAGIIIEAKSAEAAYERLRAVLETDGLIADSNIFATATLRKGLINEHDAPSRHIHLVPGRTPFRLT
ncbi:hypothetical protein [Acuticoccus yangtzensis]|uniref:hypothetical protein n=1 Tax=Acuticoccus yangtzensis TaxID=1443441 RepID=UPI0009499042|nr:hypothetical protein [Acuticoccus yangtzensis]